jgi:gluconokinase
MTAPAPRSPRTLIVMGVCGCGKSLIGARLAAALGGVFEDADDFHTDASKAKMRAGSPLTDDDRWPWFERLRVRIEAMREQTPVYVLACSALKAVYRERLRAGDGPGDLVFLHLKGSRELIFGRMSARQGHYMPVSLLDSQLAILEETPDLWTVAIDREPEAIAAEILDRLKGAQA